MTRTTPGPAPRLQASAPHQREGTWPLRMIWLATGPIHCGSSVKSGSEPGVLRPHSRDITTRTPRPWGTSLNYILKNFSIHKFCKAIAFASSPLVFRGKRE
ncbi:hypothetical protein AVEN_177388-1 [Araneus ventricosus]|uniref:Uncharacterized protein n=1 Tax=Araneus ventricosus TaxID=182803 RepID=A0A4Y2SZQ0_ARAVE|nr:hypothetical protein AVEN_177388-1 [Araneus ventricosus]